MSEYLHYEKNFTVAVDEIDYLERLKISAVLQYFQDLATVHADHIGIGYTEMCARNLVWVVNRVSARIFSQPRVEETVRGVTYPRKPNMVDAIRDYYIYGDDGRLLVTGTSKWCVLDMQSHAIRRVAPLFRYAPEMYKPEDAIENGNPKIEQNDSVVVEEATVRITELDRNRHVNNARYGDMILNCCPYEFFEANDIVGFDINYMSELKYGNQYTLRRSKNNAYFEATTSDGTDVFRATVQWKQR